jgi:peptidoglycan/LPS O-acetylase OafA/YrhL
VAVLLVVLNHAGLSFLGGGYVGVDVFFVVSGFLITGLLLRDQAEFGRIRFLNFYARRARRILPMAALTLIATDVAALVLLNYVRARSAIEDSIWATFFAANIQFERIGADYFASTQPPSPIQHFWSLAVEEQFYLVWPALLALLLTAGLIISARRDQDKANNWPVGVALTVIVAASVAWSIAQTRNVPSDAYFSALTRAWELGAGAALAASAGLVARIPGVLKAASSWLGLAGILVSSVWFTAATPFPGIAALLPVGATVLTVAGGTGASRFGADVLLGLRPFRFVGDVSYSFYLWHWPFLVIAAGMTLAPLGLTSKLGLVVAAFVTSVLTYLLYENPLRRARFLFGRRGRGALALWPVSIASVGLVAFLALNSLNAAQLALEYTGIPSPVASPSPLSPGTSFDSATAAVAAAVAAANANAPIPSPLSPPIDKLASDVYPLPFGCEAGPTENRSKMCPLGAVNSSRTVVVFGDSHAMMWLSPLVAIAQNRALKLIPFTKSSCHDAAWITGDTTCSEWYQWAVGQIKSIRPSVVVIGHCSTDCGVSDWSGFREAIRSLSSATPRVVVLGDPPGSDIEPADCLLSSGATMRTCTYAIPASKAAIIDYAFSTTQAEGAEYVDVLPWFCYQGQCPTVIGETIAWSDKGHISRTYGLQLVASLDKALKLTA